MTAEDVRKALRSRYSDNRRYAVAEEVGLTTGFSHRRLDMMVLDCYNSNGFRIDGFEIKVSTSDLRRELAEPEKHIAFFDVIDYYTLAVPPGVVDSLVDVIPKKWGILIINDDGGTRYKRRPLALEDKKADKAVPRGFFASVVRSIQSRQPSQQELDEAYESGRKYAEESMNRHFNFDRERVKEQAAKLDAYDNLMRRFRCYGNVEAAMNEFETFRSMNPEMVMARVRGAIKHLSQVAAFFEEGGDHDA